MIESKKDYKDYIEADRIANHIQKRSGGLIAFRLRSQYNFLYIRYLRLYEYLNNCKKGFIWKIIKKIVYLRLQHWSAFTGITIPPNTFGKGLYIPHWGSIVVNGSARFGDNCVVQSGVNVSEGVIGGSHIYLAAGSKILMNVHLADDLIVGANSVVTKNIQEANVVIGGIPATIISNKGFRNRIKV